MAWHSLDRLQTHGLLIGLASISIAALAVTLVQDAWQSTRQTLMDEATQQCVTAVGELGAQFIDRASLVEGHERTSQFFEAQDVSLRGLSATVLRPYEGSEGGFLLGASRRMAGQHGESFVLPNASTDELESEAKLVLELAERATTAGGIASASRDDTIDLVVGCAMAIPGHDAVAWVLKRLSGANDPAAERRRWWLVGLVLLAVLGVGMIASISMRLRRGVDALHTGLSRLEDDFEYRLPPIGGDLGSVAYAINRMAERRGALELTLRRQDRLAALGKVVSGVAHEIRNPLNSLMLTLEVLDRRVRKGAAAGDEVRQAIDEVDRLDQILARLLAFGRPDFDNRRVQDVRPLLERALRIVDERAQRKRVSIAVHTPATDLLSADVDALAIEQILINLLLNGIDASPEGGTIKVATFADRDGLRVEVADSGDGIPADVHAQIFNPFFTTKENGTGLGLALSREMASHHGGTLEFESNGGGTTFVLRLPSRLEPV